MRASLPVLLLILAIPGAAACEGLSPGDEIQVNGAICTLGFLVADPSGLYFSTAGHCVREGDVVESPGVGAFGVGAFRYLEPDTGQATDGAPGQDFGLVRIDPSYYDKLNPAVCAWGGPTGIYRESPGGGEVRHYGHGLVFGDGGPATQERRGLNLWTDLDSFRWTGMGVPGDSGSAVITADGLALGVLTHVILAPPDTNGGTHLDKGFALAAEKGFRLRLVLDGEDPRAVLAEVQGASPVAPAAEGGAAPAPAPQGNATQPPPSGGSNSTAPSPTPRPATAQPSPDPESGIVPAAVQDEGPDARTPLPALPLGLSAVLLAVLVRRARR